MSAEAELDVEDVAVAPTGDITWSDDTHSYVACCYGDDGAQPGDCYVRHGIDDAEVWWVDDGDDTVRVSTHGPYSTEVEAATAAAALAAELDEAAAGEDAEDMATRLLEERAGVPDPKGRWCVWWGTVGDDSHVVDRYADEDPAQAAAAIANQKLHETHTGHLLCGYEVRRLVGGKWLPTDTSEDGEEARP